MKKSFFAVSFLTLVMSGANSNAALAPFELVSYDEMSSKALLFALSADKKSIEVYECPKNKWVSQASQCTPLGEVLPADQFESFVRKTIVRFNTSNPKKDLAPLSASDVALLASVQAATENPRLSAAATELANSQKDLTEVTEMLQHLPQSVPYQQQQAALSQKVSQLTSELSELKARSAGTISKLVTDLSLNMFKLISENNPKDQSINSYARSQMKDSLIDEVFESLGSHYNNECTRTMDIALDGIRKWSIKEVADYCNGYTPRMLKCVTNMKQSDITVSTLENCKNSR